MNISLDTVEKSSWSRQEFTAQISVNGGLLTPERENFEIQPISNNPLGPFEGPRGRVRDTLMGSPKNHGEPLTSRT